MLVIVLLTVSDAGVVALYFMGLKGAGDTVSNALAGGLGSGIGISWKFLLGLDDLGILIDFMFLASGIFMLFGALSYGKRKRAQQITDTETFE